MMNQDTQQLIDRLSKIKQLNDRISYLTYRQERGILNDAISDCRTKRAELGTLQGIPDVFSCTISPSISASDMINKSEQKDNAKKTFKYVGFATLALILLYFVGVRFLLYPAAAGMLATLYFWSESNSSRKEHTTAAKKYNDAKSAFDKSFDKFRNAVSQYDAQVEQGMELAKTYGDQYGVFSNQVRMIEDSLDKDKAENQAQLDEVTAQFNEISDVPKQYIHLLDNIILFLQSGRADDYKEALNLAIQEEREARLQAELREQEEARTQAMLAQQRAAAEEQRRHNQEMETQAALQSKIASDAAAEARRQQKEQERAAKEAERILIQKTHDQCRRCARRGRCTQERPNCAAFLPK